jgi:ribosomal protein L32
MLGTRTLSFWKSDRFARSSLLNGVGLCVPSRTGLMKRGQRRRHTARKESKSRPECLDRESHTTEQKRFHVSCVSFGSEGFGVVRARILRSSSFVYEGKAI